MTLRDVYIGIGSNKDGPEGKIRDAVIALNKSTALSDLQLSSLSWTEPVGPIEQPRFLNGVVMGKSTWSPEKLLTLCHDIEQQLGRCREREVRWGPRPIDLDLLFVGDLIRKTETLTLPHPEVPNRQFVLDPLAEIAPELIHPVLGKNLITLREMLCD